jgi:hypothetical protein
MAKFKALLFLLLHVCCACAPVTWRRFTANKKDPSLIVETGYSAPLLNYVWGKYGDRLVGILATQQPFIRYYKIGFNEIISACFYVALWYIHFYPAAAAVNMRKFDHIGRVSRKKFYKMVVPVIVEFSRIIKEIHLNDRYHPMNHGLGLFANYITCFVDTAPIYVTEPSSRFLSRLLMQPKYGGHVYKFQIATNFLGWICFYSGPHHGIVSDIDIYHNTYHLHPLKSWEFWCGDGIYNSCYGVITRFILAAGDVFTQFEVMMNRLVNRYRQRVEHTMHSATNNHAMWSGKGFRGSFPMLAACHKITVNMAAANIKHAYAPEAYHKHRGYYAEYPTGP